MPGDQMAAESGAKRERFLQVHLARPVEAGCDTPGFFRYVGREAAAAQGSNGKAHARHANRVADRHAGEIQATALDLERVCTNDAAYRLHDSREHPAEGNANCRSRG